MPGSMTNWIEVNWVDMCPFKGTFESTNWKEYDIEGELIHAANWLHAEYLWLRFHVEQAGATWGLCSQCSLPIRFAHVFRDEQGKHHLVGSDCAGRADLKLNATVGRDKRVLAKLRPIKTRIGRKYGVSEPVPEWYWRLPKEQRPGFSTIGKVYVSAVYTIQPVWKVTIWGRTPGEVVENYAAYRKLKGA